MQKMILFGYIILCLFSCVKPDNKFKIKGRSILVARYEQGHWDCSRGIGLDSTGLYYYKCLYNGKELGEKKVIIEDLEIFKLMTSIDTNNVSKLKNCLENSSGTKQISIGNLFSYTFYLNYGQETKQINFDELYNQSCENRLLDKLNQTFIKLEKSLPFWERKKVE